MQRTVKSFAPILVLLLLVLSCAEKPPEKTPEDATLVHPGDAAPAFTATTLTGETFSLEEQRGKIVVLSFFATWCAPCLEELPHLEKEVWLRFRGDRFTMLAIGREHTADEIRDFAAKMGLSFPVAPDASREIYSKYADAFIPRTIVIGSDGEILYHAADFSPDEVENMITVVETALSKLPAPTEGPTPAT